MRANFAPEQIHIIGTQNTQRLERANCIIRQQTARLHALARSAFCSERIVVLPEFQLCK